MKGLRRWIPGGAGARGFGPLFAVFFYAYGVVLLVRAAGFVRQWDAGSSSDRWGLGLILFGWLVLYLAAVLFPPAAGRRPRGWSRAFARRLQSHAMATAGMSLLLVLVCLSVLAPLLAPFDPIEQQSPSVTRYLAPSAQHPMGTDRFGRDVLSRVLYGARVSLSIGVLAVMLATVLGMVLGTVSGFLGGWPDEVIMRVVDGLLSFPRLLFVLTLLALFSNSFLLLIVMISATGWMGAARLVRAEVLRVKAQEYIQAAVSTGMGRSRLVMKHVLPNALGPVIVAATLNVGAVILLESYLSFLGMGIQPPQPTWGAMVYEGREMLLGAWWVSAFPALAIVTAVIAFNLLGDGLRDALDARSGS